ncbi:hypothetical protein [Chryseobacterium sp. ZHDP1]|uniref:hypothetical protein n=1 Tax=Chryseobacterium sp. ZHDP1 TaxID=2838877 RepID=UPI001BDFFEF5|nr:hypothetical protein [Chryseobacterium sp. ZHDP1]QWA38863.1 hypothetical protein KKI44_01225 [Chryseobacterium sp. ZHDP1]
MAEINVNAIKNEVIRYGTANPMALTPAVLSQNILLNQLAKPLSKVKGKWSFPSVLMTNLLQAFSDTWTPYGAVQFANKTAKNFQLKVNLPINPYDVYGSWVEDLYQEDKKPNEMPISKYIVDMIAGKMISELATASIVAKFDQAQVGSPNPDPTKIMDGINEVVTGIVADTTNPAFLIPIDAALANDPVAKVNAFERSLPQNVPVSNILVPLDFFFDYVEARETPSDQVIDYNAAYRKKTKYGRNLIGVPGLTKMMAWVDGNLFRLYDRKDNPAQIDDVQIQDYVMKIFIQFHLGYDFAINQYVFVETSDAAKKRGLNNAVQNKLYYPNELTLTV